MALGLGFVSSRSYSPGTPSAPVIRYVSMNPRPPVIGQEIFAYVSYSGFPRANLITYQWFNEYGLIPGATSVGYTPVDGDTALRVEVEVHTDEGETAGTSDLYPVFTLPPELFNVVDSFGNPVFTGADRVVTYGM